MNAHSGRTDSPSSEQDAAKIRGMFHEITPTYDRLNFLFSGSLDRLWRRRAAREAAWGIRAGEQGLILDLATGTGDLAAEIARVSTAQVAGADFTRAMLLRAAEKYSVAPTHPTENEREGAPCLRALPGRSHRFSWIEADGLRLPFRDEAFDAVTIAFGLRNMADKDAALREMARVTQPGGRVVILEFGQPKNPLVRLAYDLYSFTLMPWLGRIISGSDAYRYLACSIRGFWSAEELGVRMRQAGLQDVQATALMMGIVYVHAGIKMT